MVTKQPMGRREQVWAVLREATEPMSIVVVADRLGVHPNTARFHLEALAAAGRIERVTPAATGPGRPALQFRAVQAMDPAGPRNYQLLAGVLLDSLADDPAAADRAAASGREWGRRLADGPGPQGADDATDTLVALLDTLGFAPERRSEGRDLQIGLRHCPFLELAGQMTDVVCPAHLGLMQGAMESLSSDLAVHALDPFVEPDLCLAHLGAPQREGTS